MSFFQMQERRRKKEYRHRKNSFNFFVIIIKAFSMQKIHTSEICWFLFLFLFARYIVRYWLHDLSVLLYFLTVENVQRNKREKISQQQHQMINYWKIGAT